MVKENPNAGRSAITVVTARFGAIFDRGLLAFLKDDPGVDVLRHAIDADSLEIAIKDCNPQVAVIGESSVRALLNLHRAQPSTSIIVVLLKDLTESQGRQLLALGANAYLTWDASWADLSASIRFAAEGKQIPVSAARGSPQVEKPLQLTRRESEVLQLIQVGLSNLEISNELYIGNETVRSHIQSINRKLGIRRRSELLTTSRHLV